MQALRRSGLRRAGALLAAAGAAAAGACAGGVSEPKPVPTVASTPPAAAAFEEIREAWTKPERAAREALRGLLERFVAKFPDDALVPLAHVYLALVASELGDTAVADRELGLAGPVPTGTTHDLWTVARARVLRLRGEPEPALLLLAPLVGKNVDPIARSVFEEELSLAALATHRDYEAISYMDAWLRASSEESRGRATAAVTALVARLPKDVLLGALQAMRTQRTSLGYGVDIERILAQRLAQVATESGDAELARMLLDPDAGSLVVAGEAGVALGELATSRRGLNVVQGRTIGLLLPTASPGLRDESADVLRGVMWALGLPRGLRTRKHGAATATDAAAPATHAGCAAAEDAPPLGDPRPSEMLRLVTRDDAGSADRTEGSLDELVGEGAGVVVAGLDAETSARALRWGRAHSVAVVALVPPAESDSSSAFGFVLGEPRQNVIEALARAEPALVAAPVAPVIDTAEVSLYPPAGGRLGVLELLPPISCDVPTTRAGDPRFPLTEWSRSKTHAWLVSGSARCATDLVDELAQARARGVVGLTLEAATMGPFTPSVRVVSASAGVVPDVGAASGRDDELRRFSTTLGTLSFWTALGRDAATLSRVALGRLPSDDATDPRVVTQRRVLARDSLATAKARLWSTEKTGWSEDRTMKRTVCVIDVSRSAKSASP